MPIWPTPEATSVRSSTPAAAMLMGAAGSGIAFADDITITVWGQGDCPPDNCLGAALVEAFTLDGREQVEAVLGHAEQSLEVA